MEIVISFWNVLAMPTMVLLGFPMYVCSTASIPIAASLVAKGLSPGAAFVFLMVGPAINAASMTAVAKMIGVRASAVYALVIALGAVLCEKTDGHLGFAAGCGGCGDLVPEVRGGHA